MFIPNEHERTFNATPIGVKYICEFCNEGEMKYTPNKEAELSMPLLFHKCTNCGMSLGLPKMYPYIEWIEEGEDECDERS